MKTPASAIIYVSLMLTSCSDPDQPTDKFVGHWESHSFTMDISQNGNAYLVELDNPIGMLSGSYAGELTPNGLKITLPLAGEQFILVSIAGDQLDFLGEQLDQQLP
jgi:hypothetical protein